jgi:X-Pro dipeptidyl-peptidase (S15 family)
MTLPSARRAVCPFFLVAALLAGAAAGAATTASVFGDRVPCADQDGVQFCQGSVATRIESFDGVPLDVNVTLPPADLDGPFPLIVELHGYGGAKSSGPSVDRALAGYAVLNYTARGFGESCGSEASRASDASLANPDVCAERGWVRLADARYEVRDTQYLAGLLADEGVAVPDKIGVTGASYGGGQSMILAALRSRVMLPDGSLVPWQSPNGLPMEIAAAAPLIPWSSLAESLVPAGRTLDYREANPYGTRTGILKDSWVSALYLGGLLTGFYAPSGADPEADLPAWNAFLKGGEPYDGVPLAEEMLGEITAHHSAYTIDDSVAPAPLFIYNAWTDDLFPADESIRFWRKVKAAHPDADIHLEFADFFGHPRAGLATGLGDVPDRIDQHFARHLKGTGDVLPEIETYTQACGSASVEGPYVASDWDALHPGEVRLRTRKDQRFDQRGGDPDVSSLLNPLVGGPCRTAPAVDDANSATYRLPAATGLGYTLLGAPTVIADLEVSGSFAQVAARLWDVAPDGTQTLVSHALYRPRSDNAGPQVFQLHPNGWRFAGGHVPKLELLGQSPPYGREASGAFTVTVKRLELRLPVAELPGGDAVEEPAPAVLPPDTPEPGDTGVPACAAAPRDDCAGSTGGSLRVEGAADPGQERLLWKWRGAAAGFGDPTATTAFHLCVYDGGDALVSSAALPAGGTCARGRGERSCWRKRGRSFAYADAAATSDGLRSVSLRRSRSGKARIAVRAGGPDLEVPSLPLALPTRVQLIGSAGTCWEAEFDAPARRNDASGFRGSAR